jgi:hypothetical protein
MGNENALAIIQKAQQSGALIFVNKENFQSNVEFYRTEATIIQAKPEEFHDLDGKKMPNRAVTDRIGEAAGVQFINLERDIITETRDDAIAGRRTVYIAKAQGKVLMPDGTWRYSTVEEYEFDPTLRAMLEKKVDYITDTNKGMFARKTLELQKVARQRAATGARLRVIRQLVGMPVSLTATDISKPMVFSRIVRNTEAMMKSPEGRALVMAEALGNNAQNLFGKKPEPTQAIAASTEATPAADVEPENLRSANDPEPEAEPATDTASLASQANPGAPEKSPDEKRFEELSLQLEELTTSYKDKLNVVLPSKMNPYLLAEDELKNDYATIASREEMIARTKKFLSACGVAV